MFTPLLMHRRDLSRAGFCIRLADRPTYSRTSFRTDLMLKAFITGITGQDGSYLCEWLLEHDYEVHGLVHRPDALATSNIRHLVTDPSVLGKRLFLHNGAFEDATHLRRIISRARPNEFYHLA